MTSPSFQDFFNRLCQMTDIENQSHLAQALGVGRAAISLAKQKNTVPWKWVFTLAEIYNLNSSWLAIGSGTPTLNSEIQEAFWAGIPHIEPIKGHESFRLELVKDAPRIAFPDQNTLQRKSQALVSLEMIGPCMEPEIKDMDLVLVDQNSQQVRPGLIYALDLFGNLLIRRVDLQSRSMTLICDNQAFPPVSLSSEETQRVRILGHVVGLVRQFKPWLSSPEALGIQGSEHS
ncbi:MAG: LexA family transcriptional regulator [Desulfovermiculus sp.]